MIVIDSHDPHAKVIKKSPKTTPALDGKKILTREILVEINKFQLEDYAKKYFTARKKGLFRRQVPVKEMLMFEKVRGLKRFYSIL